MRSDCLLAALAAAFWVVPSAAFLPTPPVTSTVRSQGARARATTVYQQRRPSLDDELDSLRLDETKLDDKQKAELKAFRESYNLPEVLNFDGTTNPMPIPGSSGSRPQDDDDYDPLDDAKDVGIKETPWSGQATLDVVEPGTSTWGDLGKRFDLVAGDALALVAFAIVGRSMHMHALSLDGESLKTALPFVLSWLAVSPLLGAFTRDATSSLGAGVFSVVKGWALAMPLALALRGVIKGEVPPTPFIAVSMVSTLVFLAGWRAAYIAAQGDQEGEKKGNKSAGVFDLFRMVTTLINRW